MVLVLVRLGIVCRIFYKLQQFQPLCKGDLTKIRQINSVFNTTMPPKRKNPAATVAKEEENGKILESGDAEKPTETKRKKAIAKPKKIVPEENLIDVELKPRRSARNPRTETFTEEPEATTSTKKTATKKPEKSATKKEEKPKQEEKEKPVKETTKAEKVPKEQKKDVSEKKEKPEKKEKEPLKNKTETDYSDIIFSCDKKNKQGDNYNLKIASWNVDGIRAWLKKDGLTYLTKEDPDILCLQETKCSDEKLPVEVREVNGYNAYWCSSDTDGYAGVALFSKVKPLSVETGIGEDEHDEDGRVITAEFQKYFVVTVYVPNAGRKLVTLPKRLEWNEAFLKYIKDLDERKPVILCGDMNVAHQEIDLANPKANKKNAGFTQEERDGMTDFLSHGFVDTFRELYPDKTDAYTFWTYMSNSRAKNVGWRLDYFIVSDRVKDNVCDTVIRDGVYGSDHCPITLFINI